MTTTPKRKSKPQTYFVLVETEDDNAGVSIFKSKDKLIKTAVEDYELDETDRLLLEQNGFLNLDHSFLNIISNVPIQ